MERAWKVNENLFLLILTAMKVSKDENPRSYSIGIQWNIIVPINISGICQEIHLQVAARNT
jgi:hypothetical protein